MYFSTSRMRPGKLEVGRIDLNTYPVWWIDEIATTADLADNIRNGSVIPIGFILTNRGGPSLNSQFSLTTNAFLIALFTPGKLLTSAIWHGCHSPEK